MSSVPQSTAPFRSICSSASLRILTGHCSKCLRQIGTLPRQIDVTIGLQAVLRGLDVKEQSIWIARRLTSAIGSPSNETRYTRCGGADYLCVAAVRGPEPCLITLQLFACDVVLQC